MPTFIKGALCWMAITWAEALSYTENNQTNKTLLIKNSVKFLAITFYILIHAPFHLPKVILEKQWHVPRVGTA